MDIICIFVGFFLILRTECDAALNSGIRRYSTKTTYNASVLLDDSLIRDDFLDDQFHTSDACAKHVSAVLRHGIRYPGRKDINNMQRILDKLEASGFDQAKLRDVAEKFLPIDSKHLAPSGKVEHEEIGYRFGDRFPELFSKSAVDDVAFITSSKSRAIDSCDGFRRGFQNSAGFSDSGNAVIIRDDLIRFFDICDRYLENVVNNKSAIMDQELFLHQVASDINGRIANKIHAENLELSTAELLTLVVIAGSEVAIFGTSHWSQLLSDHDLELLEYASDLKLVLLTSCTESKIQNGNLVKSRTLSFSELVTIQNLNYWKKGRGFSVNIEQSCILLKNIFEDLDQVVNGEKEHKKGAFYFGHTETMVPLVSLLGLFNDSEPLKHDNYHRHTSRQFRTSHVSPFSTNLAFVLYKCDETDKVNDFMIRLLFKERPMRWPVCSQSSCLYADVRTYYSKYIDSCRFDEICDLPAQREREEL